MKQMFKTFDVQGKRRRPFGMTSLINPFGESEHGASLSLPSPLSIQFIIFKSNAMEGAPVQCSAIGCNLLAIVLLNFKRCVGSRLLSFLRVVLYVLFCCFCLTTVGLSKLHKGLYYCLWIVLNVVVYVVIAMLFFVHSVLQWCRSASCWWAVRNCPGRCTVIGSWL